MSLSKRLILLSFIVSLLSCLILIRIFFQIKGEEKIKKSTNRLHRVFLDHKESNSKVWKIANNETTMKCKKGFIQALPKAIIIGAAKSGTSSLLNFLKLNSQLKPALKPPYDEINFFNDDVNYLAGFDFLRRQMPIMCAEEYKQNQAIEKSIYFNTFASIERIYSFDPDMKLILIIRDPVECFQSYLTHIDDIHYNRNLERTTLTVNDYFEALFKSRRPQNSVYEELDRNYIVRLCNYHYSMEKWMSYFKPKNFLILNGEKFVKEPWTVLNQVEKFLSVNSAISKDNFEFVEEKGFYCLKISANSTDCMNQYKGRSKKVYLSSYVKNELRAYYRQYNQKFFSLVQQTIEW
jgi:hypothetical protein